MNPSVWDLGAALEEGAHAQISLCFGHRVSAIALERDGDGHLTGGYCDHRATDDEGDTDECSLRIKLAGVIARKLAGIEDAPLSSHADMDGAAEICKRNGWGDEILADAWLETEQLVRQEFVGIVRLAAEVLRHGSISVRVSP